MTPFLKQVAAHYFGEDNLCFIFPNRRAMAFFRKFYSELVVESGKVCFAPQCCTMNDFFYSAANYSPTDQVQLLLSLYESYKKLNPKAESLDDFIFWGETLLADFNDIDKYLVRPEQIFANIASFRAMQDDMDYLEPIQIEAIERFVGHFEKGGRYKDEFRRIWDILLPLYRNFNEALRAKGYCYEGQVYRSLAERLKSESAVDVLSASYGEVRKFVFVGLNALNECEKQLLRSLQKAKRAEFCWDYSSKWIRDPHNKSSFFLSKNIAEFPNAFQLDPQGLPNPRINILSVPSSIAQAKQLPQILKSLNATGIDTALVLPDETMLLPVLNSIPSELKELNVTMGYPMSGSGFWSLMSDIAALQLHLRLKGESFYFYHKQVLSILSNSIIRTISSPEDIEAAAKVRSEQRFYLSSSELSTTELFAKIFRPIAIAPSEASTNQIENLQSYLLELIDFFALRLKEHSDMSLELDFAKEYYLAIQRLSLCELPVQPATWFRLLDKIIGRTSVPFEGEPLKGLQIMGPLETRALDFDKLVILNANEGIFPRRNVSLSFIPSELRAGFYLPTYEYQDAVWAYYFYRMIQRTSDVWIIFDSRTEGLRNGEESRYIKQLELHFKAQIKRYEAKSPITKTVESLSIPKTAEDMEAIRNACLSASSLQDYLSCPAKFYYKKLKGLQKTKEVSEFLDNAMIGNVFHKVMQDIYDCPDHKVKLSYLREVLKDQLALKARVKEAILEEQKTIEVSGRNLIFEELILKYLNITINRDIEYIESYGKSEIEILGLEKRVKMKIGDFDFYGIIDRIDRLTPAEIRVLDYKTGVVTDEDYLINDENASDVISKLFGDDDTKRPKIAIQLYLYDRFIQNEDKYKSKTVYNTIYSPIRLANSEAEKITLSESFLKQMDEQLDNLLTQLADPNQPFKRTEIEANCKYCDFKAICGR